MKFAKTAIAVAVLGAALSSAANANSLSYGTLTDGALYSFGELVTDGTSFTDTLTFSLNSLSDLTGFLGETGISGFSADLTGGSLGATSVSLLPSAYRLDDLSAGTYTMTFKGTASTGGANIPGIYGTFFSVAAVPESDTWLMMIIGAGLVGFQLRRKQKVLRHRPLVAG